MAWFAQYFEGIDPDNQFTIMLYIATIEQSSAFQTAEQQFDHFVTRNGIYWSKCPYRSVWPDEEKE